MQMAFKRVIRCSTLFMEHKCKLKSTLLAARTKIQILNSNTHHHFAPPVLHRWLQQVQGEINRNKDLCKILYIPDEFLTQMNSEIGQL